MIQFISMEPRSLLFNEIFKIQLQTLNFVAHGKRHFLVLVVQYLIVYICNMMPIQSSFIECTCHGDSANSGPNSRALKKWTGSLKSILF